MTQFQVLGICGSLRAGSYNYKLLQAAGRRGEGRFSLEISDLPGQLPFFNPDLEAEGVPDAVTRFQQAVQQADGIIIACPEYGWSPPGMLKNALEWGSRPPGHNGFARKPLALVGASTSLAGTIRAQLQLRQALRAMQADTIEIPEVLVTFADKAFSEDGELIEPGANQFLSRLLDVFVARMEAAATAKA